MPNSTESPHIGTLAEKSLHADLKTWYAQPGDRTEVKIGRYVIDIVRDEVLIEIQTRNFSALKRKLAHLLDHRPANTLHLLHPIAQEKWIVRQTAGGEFIKRRKSPKRGRVVDIFRELVYIPHLLDHPNFSLEVLLTRQQEIWRDDGRGSWRRKRWSIHDRLLLKVVEQVTFKTLDDYRALLPSTLPQPFTNYDLAEALNCRPTLAQKMTYTLRHAGAIAIAGKRGHAHLYEPAPSTKSNTNT